MPRKHGVAKLTDLLPPGHPLHEVTDEPDVTWVARTPLVRIKPIVSSDPILFINMVTALLKDFPQLQIYIFKIEKKVQQ